jgi:hypothetical protein
MNNSQNMQQSAVDLVTRILSRRLVMGGLPTTRPDFYFQCEPGEVRKYPGGVEVRMKIWRHWSDARVTFDADTGELLGYKISRYAEPKTTREITQDEAIAAAQAEVQIPPDAELESFFHFMYAPDCKAARLEWQHVHQGLKVHGDYLYTIVHPETRRVIEYFRKWREVNLRL